MKKIFSILSLVLLSAFVLVSCNKYEMGGADTKTLTLSYGTEGNVLPNFSHDGGFLAYPVVVNQGGINRDVEWTVSVDNNPSWITVDYLEQSTEFVGTYGGDDRTVMHKGVTISVDENTSGAKRTAVIRYTVADGSSICTIVTQSK
ncbi:MAG: hypothetical protein MJZ07_09260 [Bacteroidales bacterium]|nr:hypothetical protein [Bacteroidales bacterium]